MKTVTLSQLADLLHTELYDRVIPFWLSHGIDRQCGGLFSCLNETGAAVAATRVLTKSRRSILGSFHVDMPVLLIVTYSGCITTR
jgi:N-acylglucosamine 2-epimerase